MNDFKVLQWMTGLWLAVLILAACQQGSLANGSHTPASLFTTPVQVKTLFEPHQ